MRSKPGLFVTDLDRTVLLEDATATERTLKAIASARAAGIPVVVCTARSPRSAVPIAKELGITDGYAICGSGSTISDIAEERIVVRHPMSSDLAWELVKRTRERLPGVAFSAEREERYYREERYHSTLLPPIPAVVENASVFLRHGPEVSKVNVRHPGVEDAELFAAVLASVDELGLSSVISAAGFVEVLGPGVDKGLGTRWVADRWGVDRTAVVAFGDDRPDLPMIEWAGHGVAVADAHEDVLAIADEVCDAHHEDGVAGVIERLLDAAS
jgi:Cof subfamily protein (haloacid dehalogenase superfamily)